MILDAVTRGVALFNERRYWDAHEAWEEMWLDAEGDVRLMLQAMIQFAAALHHVLRGNARGATRLIAAAAEKANRSPAQLVARDKLIEEIARCQTSLASGLDHLKILIRDHPPRLSIPAK